MNAVLREPFRYRALIKNLVLKDLKLKYRGSVIGAVWSLLHPLLLLGVYTLAFKFIMRVEMESYAYFLLVGLLPWTFFSGALQASTGSIVSNGNLIKKVYFPRQILPMAAVFFNFAQFLLALAVFLPALAVVSRVSIHWPYLALFPLLLLLHLTFTIGLAFALSALTTFSRDIAHLTEVALVLFFWITPIIYTITMVPQELRPFLMASPLAAFAIAYQDLLFWGRLPDALVTATIVGWVVVAIAGGHIIFYRLSPGFAEEV